jgi:xylulokinase
VSTRGRRLPAALGIDVGTTETKAGVVSLDGRLLALARRRHGSDADPTVGRAEQDPDAWWTGLVATAAEAVTAANADIVAMAVDGHGPTLTAVDAAGLPVHPAITWQDTRSTRDAMYLADRTGLRGWALGILPAARWLERHDPEAAGRATWYLNSWEALALRLTGRAGSFVVDEPAPLDLDVLRATGLAVERLAPRVAAGEVLGSIRPELAEPLGLSPGTPVVAGVVDAYASLHGARMLVAGDAIDVGGAAGGFGLYWDAPIQAEGSFTSPAPMPGQWLVGGAMAATGAALDWFRDEVVGGGHSTAELIAEAAAVPAGSDGLVFLPYLAGERSPLWDPLARGAFVGLTLRHGRAAMTRAILEASAYAVRHVASGVITAGGRVEAMRVCGGPARSEAWNQIKADVTGFPVEVPRNLETAVVGSAIVAATGVGAQPDLATAIRAMATIERRVEPDPARAAIYDRGFGSYVALYPAIAAVLGRHPASIESVP